MAKETHMKSMEETLKRLEISVQHHKAMIEQWVHSTSSRERVQENLDNGGLPDKGENLIPLDFTSKSRSRIAGQDSRSRILDDSLRKMKDLAEQHASMIQQWWPSTNQIITELHQEKQIATLAPSNLRLELNLEANSEEQDCGELCSLTKNQEIKELQDSTVIFDTLVVVSEIASVKRSDVIADSEIGEIVDDSIEIRWADLKLYSTEFLVKISAHKVFAKMLEKQMAGYVEMSSTIGETFGLIDSFSSFVFDPGKGIEFSLHIEMVETLGFLVSDPSGKLFSLKCAKYGFP